MIEPIAHFHMRYEKNNRYPAAAHCSQTKLLLGLLCPQKDQPVSRISSPAGNDGAVQATNRFPE